MTNPLLEKAREAIEDGDFTQAQMQLAEALIEDSANEEAWLMLADILPPDQARDSIQRVLQINPENEEAQRRLAVLDNISQEEEAIEVEATSIKETLEVSEAEENISSSVKTIEEQSEALLFEEGEWNREGEFDDFLKLLNEEEEVTEEDSIERKREDDKSEPPVIPLDLQSGDYSEEVINIPPVIDTIGPESNSIESTSDLVDANDFLNDLFETKIGNSEQEESVLGVEIGGDETKDDKSGELERENWENVDSFLIPEENEQDQISSEEEIPAKDIPQEETRQREHKRERRSRRVIWIGIAVLIVLCGMIFGGFSWYYFYGPCGVQSVIDADHSLIEITSRWDESLMLATNSSRVVIAEPLRRMVDIRRELSALEVPACMTPAKTSLQNSMFYTLEAYDKLFKYESEIEIAKRFSAASSQRKLFEQQMEAIRLCAPLACP